MYLIDTKKRLTKSLIDFFAPNERILNQYQKEMIPSFKLLLKYIANNLVWDIHYHNNTLMCSCPCSQLNNSWKLSFMSKDLFCKQSKKMIKKSFRCKSRQLSPTDLKTHLKVNSRLDIVHKLIYDYYQNAYCKFLPLKSFCISVKKDNKMIFGIQNILDNVSTKYYKYLKLSKYINVYYEMSKMVPSMKTSKRKQKMYVFGSTTGASRSPKYCHKNNIGHTRMLPRPMSYCKPGSKVWNYMNQPWFISLVKDIEMFTKQHVDNYACSCIHMKRI